MSETTQVTRNQNTGWTSLYQSIVVATSIVIGAMLIAMTGQSFVKSMAIDGCIHSSTYTVEHVNTLGEKIHEVSHIDGWYVQCMEDKGYHTSRTAE